MQDYKFLSSAVMICATLLTQTHAHAQAAVLLAQRVVASSTRVESSDGLPTATG